MENDSEELYAMCSGMEYVKGAYNSIKRELKKRNIPLYMIFD